MSWMRNEKCAHCGYTIRIREGEKLVVDEGRPYHEDCYIQVLRNRVKRKLQKWHRRGLTPDELNQLRGEQNLLRRWIEEGKAEPIEEAEIHA